MATYTKNYLSASSYGKAIVITTTGTATATTVHTATAVGGAMDEVWLYATNPTASAATLTTLWGGTVLGQHDCEAIISSQAGRSLIMDGRLAGSGIIVSCYTSASTGTILIDGFVNTITT